MVRVVLYEFPGDSEDGGPERGKNGGSDIDVHGVRGGRQEV